MQTSKIERFTLLILFLFLITIQKIYSQTAYEITKQMFAKTKQINAISFNMKKVERINGLMKEQISFTKLTRNPFRVYSKQTFPKAGLEILYVQGSNHNKALINTNGFPWINLSLSPLSSIMREDQHHTILESGYDHVISILEHLFEKYKEETKTMVASPGATIRNGDSCWLVVINNPYFRYIDYTVQQGETLLTIAKKFLLSEYMLLEKNKKVKNYENVVAGQIIQIPNDYSPKIIIYIDKKRLIPLLMQIYDDIGLYELYEYSDIVIDSVIQPQEFTKSFKEYNF